MYIVLNTMSFKIAAFYFNIFSNVIYSCNGNFQLHYPSRQSVM